LRGETTVTLYWSRSMCRRTLTLAHPVPRITRFFFLLVCSGFCGSSSGDDGTAAAAAAVPLATEDDDDTPTRTRWGSLRIQYASSNAGKATATATTAVPPASAAFVVTLLDCRTRWTKVIAGVRIMVVVVVLESSQ